MYSKMRWCKRATLSLAILLISFSVSFSQKGYRSTVKEYFRVDPFAGSFSSFVDILTSDTALHNKEVFKKTADTLFFVSGNYEIFNPFRINADTIQMAFAERLKDLGSQFSYHYYSYQISGVFPDTAPNRAALRKEFKKLKRSFSEDYTYFDYTSLRGKDENQEDGEVIVFRGRAQIASVIVLWQTENHKKLSFSILINLTQSNNMALPVSNGLFQ